MKGAIWSREHEEIMRREYPVRKAAELESILGRTKSAIISKATLMGLKKSADFWSSCVGGPGGKWDTDDSGPKRKFSRLGKHEQPPPMPGLLDHLMSMSGCMEGQSIFSKRVSLEYRETIRAAA